MKKGSAIKITQSANYDGQDMNWTETPTGKKIIGKGGEIVVHSSYKPIKEFLSKEICVHPKEHSSGYFSYNDKKKDVISKHHWKIYIYIIFLNSGTHVDTYSDDEYRFELTSDMKILFGGTIYEAQKSIERKMTDIGMKEITTYLQYSDILSLPEIMKLEK